MASKRETKRGKRIDHLPVKATTTKQAKAVKGGREGTKHPSTVTVPGT